MHYKKYNGEDISLLGMGNMRLPTKGEGFGAPINYEKAAEIIDYAIKSGINYFDTAYVYTGSEAFLGATMPKYPRESYKLATKYNIHSSPDYEKIFEESLARLNTDYVDFYLCHAIMNEESVDSYINGGAVDYFLEQKEKGRIRNLGFSSHAPVDVLKKMASHHNWDFAQIQLNYMDWTLQDAKGQYELLTEFQIPVVVMEPVRGGRLAQLSTGAEALLKAAQPDWSIPSWAFRFLMGLDNVQVILSGMSTMDQIIDNVKTFEKLEPLTDEQTKLLFKACDMFKGDISVPCTGCRYCVPECPQGIDTPKIMELYNAYKLEGDFALMGMNELDKKPSDCIACGACQSQCPQSITIPDIMTELAEVRMPGPPPKD